MSRLARFPPPALLLFSLAAVPCSAQYATVRAAQQAQCYGKDKDGAVLPWVPKVTQPGEPLGYSPGLCMSLFYLRNAEEGLERAEAYIRSSDEELEIAQQEVKVGLNKLEQLDTHLRIDALDFEQSLSPLCMETATVAELDQETARMRLRESARAARGDRLKTAMFDWLLKGIESHLDTAEAALRMSLHLKESAAESLRAVGQGLADADMKSSPSPAESPITAYWSRKFRAAAADPRRSGAQADLAARASAFSAGPRDAFANAARTTLGSRDAIMELQRSCEAVGKDVEEAAAEAPPVYVAVWIARFKADYADFSSRRQAVSATLSGLQSGIAASRKETPGLDDSKAGINLQED